MLVGKLVEVFLFPVPGLERPDIIRGTIAAQVGLSTYLLTNASEIIQVLAGDGRAPDAFRPLGRDVVIDTQSGGFHHIQILPVESKTSE